MPSRDSACARSPAWRPQAWVTSIDSVSMLAYWRQLLRPFSGARSYSGFCQPSWSGDLDRRMTSARPALLRARGRGFRQALVALEVAVALALVVGATLFGQSLLRLRRVDVGFETRGLLTFDIVLVGERAEYQSKQVTFFEDMLRAIRAAPGCHKRRGCGDAADRRRRLRGAVLR